MSSSGPALHPLADAAGFSNRAQVADTLRFRRRKGTAAMLEDLARVSTGFSARAVEFFETLSTTQHVNHVRLQAPGTAGVRDANAMELVRGPFDTTPHTVDVRTMDDVYGWHNLPNIGLFVWPVPSYPLDRATAVAVAQPPDGRWLVDPLGADRAMAGPMVVETSIDHRAEEANVPGPLRRRPLHDELDERRAAPSAQRQGAQWFDADDPAVVVWIQDTPATELTSVPLDLLFVGDLSDWSLPTGQEVRLDPVLGRIAVSPTRAVNRVAVSWHYAFSGDVGAGPYPRRDANPPEASPIDFQIGVSATDAPVANTVVATFGEAVDAWNAFQAGKSARLGRIVVMDSHRYAEALTSGGRIQIGQGNRLTILAAQWPEPADRARDISDALDPQGVRPCLVGDVEVIGQGSGDQCGELVVDGLLLQGSLTVTKPAAADDGLGRVELRSCTLVPASGGLSVQEGNDRIAVALHRTICGPVALADDGVDVDVFESIIDSGAGAAAVAAPGTTLTAAGLTALGSVDVRYLEASDSIFDDTVTVARRQWGCVRFSYVTPGSATPRRYRCQPQLAEAAAPADPDVAARLEPAYVSDQLTNPGYARLAERARSNCAPAPSPAPRWAPSVRS